MKTTQKGFTLIELMIVVAIIAILAAIAVPAYQNYIIRSKVSEAISAIDMARTAVSETFQTKGTVPGSNASAGLPATAASVASKYVSDLEVQSTGAIKATVTGTNAADADGKFIFYVPYESNGTTALASGYSGPIVWKCDATQNTVAAKYLPAICR
ncbi:pilin [Dyella flagellata]|uniref:Pilin n=1 Tax=Dyella flagellata TaxID=1867833 RepID=A0ABQ5XA78_9GAMM|nr:pilin [Dyella flagellata]GLQ88537.1 pilin [Dyella flagellata]